MAYGDYLHVRLTETEYDKLVLKHGQDVTDDYISQLDLAIADGFPNPPNHFIKIIRWINKDKRKKKAKPEANQQRNRFANFQSRERDYQEIERKEREFLMKSVENMTLDEKGGGST